MRKNCPVEKRHGAVCSVSVRDVFVRTLTVAAVALFLVGEGSRLGAAEAAAGREKPKLDPQLVERWDAAYRDGKRPPWDTGRPSTELRKVIEREKVQPGRAVELGCGTGSSAVYLAQLGFDVTAVDVAPTALRLAEEKAKAAGVRVNWVLADVVQLPELGQFDLIFDRGCYHGVRRENGSAYVAAMRRLSHPGTRFLLLAGNSKEKGGGGPPRVSEEELRRDFAEWFEVERLEEIRFDTREKDGAGALAWSAWLRRK